MNKLYYIEFDVLDNSGNWERRKTFFTFSPLSFNAELHRKKHEKNIVIVSYTDYEGGK